MRKSRVNITCETCGTIFEVQSHRRDIARFCCHDCYRQWRNGKALGRVKLNSALIIEEYMSGKSTLEIATMHSVSVPAVCYHLKKHGIKVRPPTGKNFNRPEIREKANKLASLRKGNLNHKFIELPVDDIVRQYAEGDSSAAIAKRYGVTDITIIRRLINAGVKMRRAGFGRKRKCPDGHIVDSQWEYAVDRWLHEHGIDHEIHPTVPWWKGGRSPQRADFKVGDIYIEVWGVINNRSYNQKRQSKIEKFQSLDIQLIEIFPHHVLSNDFSSLEILLR